MFCDSQSAIHLAKNQVYQKIKTDDNPADMLTKVVTAIKFNHCLDLINIAKV